MKTSDEDRSLVHTNDGGGLPTPAGQTLWNEEYRDTKAIPSSDRAEPSQALLTAEEELDLQSVDTAIDMGCGNGRNTVYLAEQGIDVYALDFAEEAIAKTQQQLAQSGLSDAVTMFLTDVTEGLPFVDDAVDLIVDSYMSCHLFEEAQLEEYFAEVRRVLSPEGKFYWAGLGTTDEYYNSIADTHPATNTIVDPLNGIAKRLYDADQLKVQLPFGKSPETASELVFEDEVDNELYQRSIVWAVFEN